LTRGTLPNSYEYIKNELTKIFKICINCTADSDRNYHVRDDLSALVDKMYAMYQIPF